MINWESTGTTEKVPGKYSGSTWKELVKNIKILGKNLKLLGKSQDSNWEV